MSLNLAQRWRSETGRHKPRAGWENREWVEAAERASGGVACKIVGRDDTSCIGECPFTPKHLIDVTRSQLTPGICTELAKHLAEAIEKFRRWDIRVVNVNRLEEGRRLLNAIAAVGAYPEDTEELKLIGRALMDALEFRYISYAMPDEKLEALTKELQRAVGGTLTRVGNQESYQFQTQFWVGAIIGLSEVTPIIPPPSAKKNPDYFVQNGTMYYGIEVKRPSGLPGAEKALRSAASQLRARNVDGAIVVDVSECIVPGGVEIIDENHREVGRLACDDTFREVANRLGCIVYDDERQRLRTEFPAATVVVITAHICQWNLSDLRYPLLMRPSRFGTYFRVNQRNLAYHRALWLRDILLQGIQAAGHEINRE